MDLDGLLLLFYTEVRVGLGSLPKRRNLCSLPNIHRDILREVYVNKSGNRLIDLTGKDFGEWHVIQRVFTGSSHAKYLCRCSCGNEKILYGFTLYRGVSKSCRHGAVKDITGQTFGYLTVIERYEHNSNRAVTWKCVCVCGKEVIAAGTLMRYGEHLSCRECGLKKTHQSNITHGKTNTKEYYKLTAVKRRELMLSYDSDWTLEMECALQELQAACVVCGSDDRLATDHVYPLSKGHGLSPGNAVKLCKSCNSSKASKTPEELSPDIANKILSAAESFRIAWESGYR